MDTRAETMSGKRVEQLMAAADILMDARRTGTPIDDLPPEVRPETQAEAYFVQDTMAASMGGETGGWKVGAPSPEATPMFAPMPRRWMAANGALLNNSRYRGLEAEVAFLLGADLPARSAPYCRDEVLAAVASCHPVIEVLESGLRDPSAASRLSMIADLQMHGGFVYGPAYPDWRAVNFSHERVILAIEGMVRVERTGSNTAGDLFRLLPWLATYGAARTGGLRAGQWITTGSWTGNTQAEARADVDVTFSSLGRVALRFNHLATDEATADLR